mgnify:FL=1
MLRKDWLRKRAGVMRPPRDPHRAGAAAPPNLGQVLVWTTILSGTGAGLLWAPHLLWPALHHGFAALFVALALWRLAAIGLSRPRPPPPALPDERLPRYSVLAPMYREADMVAQCVAALDALDYPRDRLQVLLVLEADDAATQAAAAAQPLPTGFSVFVAPPGEPRTKPRACNHALAAVTGELVTIYDAEDRPDPQQLRQAAAAFGSGPPSLACVQAPLRVEVGSDFLSRQFALEYAALFEVTLPALARLGLAFPLGGTSNHLHTATLRALGGWDPYNVTEDADLGFRLARAGYAATTISAATRENAPASLYDWLPQRTRWLKGYMQTLGVQTRAGPPPPSLAAALLLTLGVTLASALVHLPTASWLAAYLAFWLLGGPGPSLTLLDACALAGGVAAALLVNAVGARRARLRVRSADILLAPLYWPLLTLAFLHAAPRLLLQPHKWDKTDHSPWPFPAR